MSERRPKVWLSRRFPGRAEAILAEVSDVERWPEGPPPSPPQVARALARVDGALISLTEVVRGELLPEVVPLRGLSTMSAGLDHLDLPALWARGVTVTHTPEAVTETTADLAFALILAAARGLPEAERALRAGRWGGWTPLAFTGVDVHGAALGVVGLGRIGRAVARRAVGFDMTVRYTARHRASEAVERESRAAYVDLDTLLETSDVVVLCASAAPGAAPLVGAAELARMRDAAVLVNVGRGSLVDEEALHAALAAGRLAGVGLDVWRSEPIGRDHPLLGFPRLVALPHIGSASVTTRANMAETAAKDLARVLRGEAPRYPAGGAGHA